MAFWGLRHNSVDLDIGQQGAPLYSQGKARSVIVDVRPESPGVERSDFSFVSLDGVFSNKGGSRKRLFVVETQVIVRDNATLHQVDASILDFILNRADCQMDWRDEQYVLCDLIAYTPIGRLHELSVGTFPWTVGGVRWPLSLLIQQRLVGIS